MASPLGSIASLMAAACLVSLGNGLMGTVVALRASADFAPMTTAVVLSAYYVGLALGPLTVGALMARIGHIRVFAACAAASSTCLIALLLSNYAAVWIASRVASGYAMAGVYMALESWLHSKATSQTRGRVLAAYITAVQLSLSAGQLLLFMYPPSDERVFSVAAMLHAMALVPIALTYIEAPAAPSTERFGIRALFRAAPLGVLGCFASGLVVAILLTLGPAYVVASGYGAQQAAVFVLVFSGSGLALQWVAGKLSDRVGRRPVLIAVGLGLALACAPLVAGAAVSYQGLLVLAMTLGALAFLLYPLATAYANDLVAPHQLVAVSGTLIAVFAVGGLIGPLVGTAAVFAWGAGGPFAVVGIVGLSLSASCLYRMWARPAIPHVDWSTFAPRAMPQATPSGELQPDVPWHDRRPSP